MKKVLYYIVLFVAYVVIATAFEMIVYLFFGGPVPILQLVIIVATLYIVMKLNGRIKSWMKID